ncbi:hypothetical protein BIV23_44595 [Streptomyces monashensis]|uniref:Uncharacterized protein n=1 Tax=Streptomyces monashensis TaxID=1678012 RepID=A0A1S2NUX6_9ACTN|nr:hypothetical protein BIV23_44595 [Streptomyces monashensis]
MGPIGLLRTGVGWPAAGLAAMCAHVARRGARAPQPADVYGVDVWQRALNGLSVSFALPALPALPRVGVVGSPDGVWFVAVVRLG